MSVPKISSISMIFRPNHIKKTLPVLAAPLLAYYIGENQDNNANEILNFFRRKNIKIPDLLKPHADTKSGFNPQSKTKLKKALDEAYQKNIITEKEHDKYVKKLTFTGSSEEDMYQYSGTEDSTVFDAGLHQDTYDIFESSNAAQSDITDSLESLSSVVENPFILGVAAEIVPFARFVKPGKDFLEGDFEKAAIGTLTRGIDVLISPLKLLAAAGKGLSDAILGSAFNDDSLNFIDGFKGFYNDWANARDNIEDELLRRETAPQKRERLQRIKEELKETTSKVTEPSSIETIIKDSVQEQQAVKIQKSIQQDNTPDSPKCLSNKDTYLTKVRKKFENVLARYKTLKPDADTSQYDNNYMNWNAEKLKRNIRVLNNQIHGHLARKRRNA